MKAQPDRRIRSADVMRTDAWMMQLTLRHEMPMMTRKGVSKRSRIEM